MRIALGLEYDGSVFCGWQTQPHAPSVQDALEQALSNVADHRVGVVCAGRTDTGVHAAGQVVHFDSASPRSERSWVFGANANLPKSVCVLWARPVADDFHARFCAVRRRYRYVIFNRHVRPTYLQRRVTWDHRPLDVAPMAEAARYLLGEHDFTAYRAVACQAKSPIRTLYRLDIHRQGQFVFLDLEANAFLHHMVRNIAGVLMTIGAGEQAPIWAKQVLEQRDRTQGGVTAPPYGLYLAGVIYPEQYGIPPVSPSEQVW
ncbi:MAG: hypothetical protein AMJ69_04160 [Gammaproteobacteria bacterium SG8_47]|nr:MAG: hypothetical protein AMJ69_04160 [Gammaproteobacteria bacterium SG8_47]